MKGEQQLPREGQVQPHAAVAEPSAPWWSTPAVCLGLVLLVAVPFAQVGWHDFTVCDDDHYITRNPLVLKGLTREGFFWAFADSHAGNWHPLTWLSHMTDCQLFRNGPQLENQWPGGHHLVNVGIHTVGVLLLFLALRLMTGQMWPSAVAAALFAVHPLRAESVAWAAERKDVLSGMFWMLTLLVYAWYAKGPQGRASKVLYLVGFSLVHLPLVAALIWQLKELDVLEGSKFYVVSLLLATPGLACAAFAWYIARSSPAESKSVRMVVFSSVYWELVAILVLQLALLPYFAESTRYVVALALALASLLFVSFCGCFQLWPAALGLVASGKYLLVAVAMAMGLMSKSMVVTLPCVLLLLDLWPMNRWIGWPDSPFAAAKSPQRFPRWPLPWLLLEKVPWFAMAFADCWITFVGQRGAGAVNSLGGLSAESRVLNALASYYDYVEKMFWPTDLTIFYPHPAMISSSDLWSVLYRPAIAGWLLAAVTLAVVWFGLRRRYLITGWFWYLGTLVPVIGLIQVGTQALADRYTYLPSVGISLVGVWGLRELASRWSFGRTALWVAAPAAILVCAVLTTLQVRTWKNDFTVFEHALAVTEHNYFAHCHLGIKHDRLRQEALENKGRAELKNSPEEAAKCQEAADEHQNQAEEKFRDALMFKPDYDIGNNCLGVYCAYRANPAYQEALKLAPGSDSRKERMEVAHKYYRLAIHHIGNTVNVNPYNADAHNNLGTLSRMAALQSAAEAEDARTRGRTDEAQRRYRDVELLLIQAQTHGSEAVRLHPEGAADHLNLGITLVMRAELERTLKQFGLAIQSESDSVQRNDLGRAIEEFRAAIKLKPDAVEAYRQLAQAHLKFGEQYPAARISHAEQAANVLDGLGIVWMQQGNRAQAAQALEDALRVYPGHKGAQQHLSQLQAGP